MVLDKSKAQPGKTLFIDARNMGYMKDRTHRELSCGEETEEHGNDIARIADTFEQFRAGTLETEKGFSAIATIKDIEKQDFILTPGRYVGIAEVEEDGEPFQEKWNASLPNCLIYSPSRTRSKTKSASNWQKSASPSSDIASTLR